MLTVSRERGWRHPLEASNATCSTAVLAAVRALNSLESVGESMRAALNDLAKEDPEWLLSHLSPDWFDRYVHRFPDDALSEAREQTTGPASPGWRGCGTAVSVCRPGRRLPPLWANYPLSHGSDRSFISITSVHRQGDDGVMDLR